MIYRIFLASFVLFLSCGKLEINRNEVKTEVINGVNAKGLAFVGEVAGSSRKNIMYWNLQTGDVEEVSAGESNNVLLQLRQNNLYVFNRADGESNFYHVNLDGAQRVKSRQMTIPGVKMFEPDSVSQARGKMFFNLPSLGKVSMFDPDKETFSDLKTDPASGTLRPASVVEAADGKINLVHQGIAFDDNGVFANKTQKILNFKVEETDGNLKFSQESSANLNFSDPIFVARRSDKVVAYSICPVMIRDCKSGIESYDQKTAAVSVIWDWSDVPYQLFGELIPDNGGFYATLAKPDMTEAFVAHVDFATKEIKKVHQFRKETGSFFMLAYDEPTRILFVGDANENKSGMIYVYRNDKKEKEFNVKQLPRSGLLVP